VGTRCTGIEEDSLEPFGFPKKWAHSPSNPSRYSRPAPARSISSHRRGCCAVLLRNGGAATHLEVVQRTVCEAEARWGKYAELQPRGQDFPFRTGLNPISAVMQIYSEIGPGNGLHPTGGISIVRPCNQSPAFTSKSPRCQEASSMIKPSRRPISPSVAQIS
jgi:hypothetical protein